MALSPEEAAPGVELTATLTDPEGGVSASGQITGERWTWHRGTADDFIAMKVATPLVLQPRLLIRPTTAGLLVMWGCI